MAETGFKHIAVTAAEEDDFVIRAGVSDQHEPEPEPELEEQEEVESADSSEMVVDEKAEPDVEPMPEPAPARKPAAK